jgi:hypothetical protein
MKSIRLLSTGVNCIGILLSLFCLRPATASIVVNSSVIRAWVNDIDSSPVVQNVFSGTTIPTSISLDAVEGAVTSENNIEFSATGGQTELALDIDHSRPGTPFSLARTLGFVRFTAAANTSYELSGNYDVNDVGNFAGDVFHFIGLTDETAGILLFWNIQESIASEDEQFTFGQTGGDWSNTLSGSVTGSIVAGHTYLFNFESRIRGPRNGDHGATALGNISLTIREAAAVPEPLSLFTWALFAISGILVTRRRFQIS